MVKFLATPAVIVWNVPKSLASCRAPAVVRDALVAEGKQTSTNGFPGLI
eukprot:COSAG05_NODE_12459_length_467_cov_1.016304_1_plen_48_part_10